MKNSKEYNSPIIPALWTALIALEEVSEDTSIPAELMVWSMVTTLLARIGVPSFDSSLGRDIAIRVADAYKEDPCLKDQSSAVAHSVEHSYRIVLKIMEDGGL